ncbi:MAG: cytochrome c3 family protein [Methanosarcinaceae archaeon]|nr:cytochrome c3 family protein [Methanosarcinaceae archaeon]
MAARKLIIIIFMGMFFLTALASWQSGMHYIEDTRFCKFCHEAEYNLYNEPGDSIDYAHNTHGVSCSDCHKKTGAQGEMDLSFNSHVGLMLIFDIAGTSPPPNPDDRIFLESKERCLKCHEDYQTLMIGRIINPHESVDDCAACHSGHERGMSEDVCAECHIGPVTSLHEIGGKHSKKGCDFCHPQHGFVPQCSDCHGLHHSAEFTNCTDCHTNAHAPGDIEFKTTDVENDVCGVCHSEPQQTFEVYPTKHADLECSMCHSKHGSIPKCTNCHQAHDDTMTADDCEHCHDSAHRPTKVIYPVSTPTSLCEGCHSNATHTMEESETKHSELPCAQCHPQHAQIPTCPSCHATPHGPALTDCGVTCHISAHSVWDMKERK